MGIKSYFSKYLCDNAVKRKKNPLFFFPCAGFGACMTCLDELSHFSKLEGNFFFFFLLGLFSADLVT